MTYRYRYFGLFRLLLASLVMLQHFAANVAPEAVTLNIQPYEPGSIAVLVFFCLSGFVIAEAADLAYRRKPGAFLSNRALRIIPHFLVAMLISMIVQYVLFRMGQLYIERHAAAPAESIFAPSNLIINILSILPYADRKVAYSFIPIVWAVRVEIVFYIAVFISLWLGNTLLRGKKDGFGWASAAIFAVFVPLYCLGVMQRLPAMLTLMPYFAFGMAYYFALKGKNLAICISFLCLPMMAWSFFSQPEYHPVLGFERAVLWQWGILSLLIAMMCQLATKRFAPLRKPDAVAGSYTYPLYLDHFIVMVLAASLFSQSMTAFIAGMVLSVLFSIGMARLIDPVVDRWRDRVRGQKLSG